MCKLSGVRSRIHHWVERSVLVELVVLVTQRTCEALCTADPGCRGAAHRTSDQNCGLFDSGTSQEYIGCLACTGFAKQCPTEPPTAVPEVIISNGTMDCVCVCKDTNQTVDEKMQRRKSELTVDTEAPSSTLRKFSSAPDARPTSTAIGAVGATMIGMLLAFIVLPDLFMVLYSIIKYFKNVKL